MHGPGYCEQGIKTNQETYCDSCHCYHSWWQLHFVFWLKDELVFEKQASDLLFMCCHVVVMDVGVYLFSKASAYH